MHAVATPSFPLAGTRRVSPLGRLRWLMLGLALLLVLAG